MCESGSPLLEFVTHASPTSRYGDEVQPEEPFFQTKMAASAISTFPTSKDDKSQSNMINRIDVGIPSTNSNNLNKFQVYSQTSEMAEKLSSPILSSSSDGVKLKSFLSTTSAFEELFNLTSTSESLVSLLSESSDEIMKVKDEYLEPANPMAFRTTSASDNDNDRPRASRREIQSRIQCCYCSLSFSSLFQRNSHMIGAHKIKFKQTPPMEGYMSFKRKHKANTACHEGSKLHKAVENTP